MDLTRPLLPEWHLIQIIIELEIKGSPSIDLARGPTPFLDHSNGKPYSYTQ